jgi:hypothetical protein
MKLKSYKFQAKIEGDWQDLCIIQAANHTEAFRKAMLLLSPDLYSKQIRLEEVAEEGNAR